jgi:hypothetical protein
MSGRPMKGPLWRRSCVSSSRGVVARWREWPDNGNPMPKAPGSDRAAERWTEDYEVADADALLLHPSA